VGPVSLFPQDNPDIGDAAGAPEPLRLTLSDLRSAESKGKWWLIGAAWRGDPLVDRQRAAQVKHNITHDQKKIQTGDDEDDVQALMDLSRKQGMNTDIRRSVFVVLMQSDVSYGWRAVLRFQLSSGLFGSGLRRCVRAARWFESNRGAAARDC
jgi:hypothetical protein